MSVHRDRAFLLFEQSRHDLAETELRHALGEDPDDAMAHSLLALCLCKREQYKEAALEAETAIHKAPSMPFTHYALASIMHQRNRDDEALVSVKEALSLDPYNAHYFSLLASIHFSQRRWPDALEAAEQGLASDPENTTCTNLRAMALVKLGRRQEAGATIDAALSRDPENTITHANQGWTLLEKNDPQKAMEHFREALRLDPNNEWARMGIVEALKARHFTYSLMLRYFLWMNKLSRRAGFSIVFAAWIGVQILSNVADNNPTLAPFIWPVIVAYVVFCIMTWIARPVFNLTLRLNRFGKLALSKDQISESNWIGGCFFLTSAMAIWWLIGRNGAAFYATIFSFCLLMPLSGTFNCGRGWPRRVMAGYTLGLVLNIAALLFAPLSQEMFGLLVEIFIWGTCLSVFVSNFLGTIRLKK